MALVSSLVSRALGVIRNVQEVGPVPGRKMSTPWRKRPKGWPNRHTYWKSRGYHTGADWSAPIGTPFVALNDGFAIKRDDKVLGRCILLFWQSDKSHKRYTSWYCHASDRSPLDSFPTVTRNIDGLPTLCAVVKAGDVIGLVGATGSGVTGPHLHVEKRRGWTRSWRGEDLDPMRSWGR